MWASCMFIHEMRLEKQRLCLHCRALHALHFCSDLKLPGKTSESLTSPSFSLPPPLSYLFFFVFFYLSFSVDCEPVGGLIEDAFLWGTEVILRRH